MVAELFRKRSTALGQPCNWLDTSTARLVSSVKLSIALLELLDIHANSEPCQQTMPRVIDRGGMSFWRPGK